jgi:hypothetical protein
MRVTIAFLGCKELYVFLWCLVNMAGTRLETCFSSKLAGWLAIWVFFAFRHLPPNLSISLMRNGKRSELSQRGRYSISNCKPGSVYDTCITNTTRTMACTYSIPAIITSQPPVAIPYEDNPYEEGSTLTSTPRHCTNWSSLISSPV